MLSGRKTWKNLDPIDDKSIEIGMNFCEVEVYLRLWATRAKAYGMKRRRTPYLGKNEFQIYFIKMDDYQTFGINFGTSRRVGPHGIGSWSDGWIGSFVAASKTSQRLPLGALNSLSAFCDEFNTMARFKS